MPAMYRKRVSLQSLDDVQGLLIVLLWLELIVERQPADAVRVNDKSLPSCQGAEEVRLDAKALPQKPSLQSEEGSILMLQAMHEGGELP